MSQTKDKPFVNSSIHGAGANINSGSITIGANSHQSLQTSGGAHLPLHSVRSSGPISQQAGHAAITYPLQLTNNLNLQNAFLASQSNTPASTTITDAKKIHLQITNPLSKNIEHSAGKISERRKTITITDPSMIVTTHEIQKKPLQIKLQSVPGAIPIQTSRSLQISSNAVSGNNIPVNLQMPMGQAAKQTASVISSQPQITTAPNKPTPHMIYIHTSTGLKPVPSTDILPSTTVRLPGSSGIQLMSSLNAKSSAVKPMTNKPNEFTGNLPQSLVIQKPKTSSQNLVSLPVNLSANPSGKHTFAAFVSAIKKPPPASKPPESQKVIITPMNVPKVHNKLIFPQSVPTAKVPYINFQIANGQVQNDPQGSITVMQDSNNCVIPPLQPITSVETITNESPSVSNIILDSQTSTSDNSFTTSIPGSRAELIGEQEYTLSIPDNSCMSDEVITVSISDDNEGSHEASYTINIPGEQNDIVQDNSTLMEGTQCVISTKLPGILSRSSSDDCERVEQRRIANDKNADDIENKIEKAKKKLFNKSYSILKKSIPDKDGTSQNQSLYCEEIIDLEVESKNVDVEMVQPMKKPVETTVPSIPPIVKDRRKSRVSSDVYLQSEPTIIVDKDLTAEEDSLGIQWQNNIGKLNGSFLQFHTNEFGLIDVVDSPNDVSSSLPKYQTPLKQRIPRDGVKKPTSPEDLYCCDGCGCHGMAAEFITPNFCSHTCQRNHNKDNGKDKALVEMKKKRKPRKSLLSKREDNGCNISKMIPKSSLDSLSQDITVKMVPSETSSQNSASKWKHENGFIWYVYLDCCNAIQAPEKLFRISKESKHNFKPGMKLEAIDPHNQSVFTVVTVTEIQGYRLKLHFDGYEDNYDYWVNADSCDIFPPGWCEKNGKALIPPQGYTRNSFSWAHYVKQTKAILAPRYLFPHVLSVNPSPSIFRVGMKLEAEDRKNSLTCVATITDVMDNRLLIHFDSWNEKYDFWVHPTSPYIHPFGWCDKNGYRLTPPNTYKDPESFTWEGYLEDSRSPVVPARAFRARPPLNFKVGMKLEAVDKRVPFLIRVATVTEVRPYQIRISFDGLPDELSFWVEDDSPDIYPVGWCLKTGHPLEPPLTHDESKIPGPCGTNGCQGLGNINGKSKTHLLAAECPYHLPPKSPEIPDRLASSQPQPQYTEPRPREAKRSQRGRPPKYKVVDNDRKLETASDDDSSCSATKKRKRAVSPMSQETVERSVFEPGYTPNPNWNSPPTWGLASRCMPLDDILQRLSLRTDPRNWSQTDVQEFVEKIAKSREVSWRFCKQRIDGESFLMLAQEDLVSVLGMRLGPAIKIYNSIIQLRKKIVV